MAIQQIEFEDKEAINIDSTVPDKNKCNASDLNEIKSVVNSNSYETPNITSQIDTNYKLNVLTTKNLFDKNSNIISGYFYNDTTGEITATITANNYLQETYIKVKPNTEYTISAESGSQYLRIVEYNSSKTYIKTTNSGGGVNTKTITTTINTEYVRLSMAGSNVLNTLIFNEGTNTTYETFIPNTINVNNEKYTDTINVGTSINDKNRVNILFSKNLLDLSNTQTNLGITSKYNSETGEFSFSGQAESGYSNLTSVKSCNIPAGDYIISLSHTFNKNMHLILNFEDGTGTDINIENGTTTKTFTTTKTAISQRFYTATTSGTTYNESFYIQLEKGSTATPFNKYIGTNSINIDGEEILYAIQNINFSINTNYVYDTASDFNVKCLKIGKTVVLALSTIAFKTSDIPNYGILISGLPKATSTKTFYLNANVNNTAPFRVSVATDGNLKRHWTNDPISGDSANKQYYGFLVYDTTD